MKSDPPSPTVSSASYAACRHGGAPPEAARMELGLPWVALDRLERQFLARPGRGEDAMRPRFARHEAHVRAVLRQGGYPVLPERGR